MGDLEPHFDHVERLMSVREVAPEVQGRRNELFRDAAEKIGIKALAIHRNEEGCKGSGECLTGCPNQAKMSTDIRGIPEIVRKGGRLYSSVAIEKLLFENGRARGAVGQAVGPNGEKGPTVRFHAQTVIVAAGAIGTPEILFKSGVDLPGVGRNLRFHPGTALMGVFDDEVAPWSGATQGYHSLEYIDRGIKLESLWAIPSLLAFRFPGVGSEFQGLLSEYKNMACWDVWVSGDDSVGRVRPVPFVKSNISYSIGDGDMDRLKFGMTRIADMFFAAGAKRVVHGVHGLPAWFEKPSDVDLLRQKKMTPGDLLVGSNHVFGTTAMGADPTRHVVDDDLKVHGTENLYIADTGIFPATCAVNPMLTVMALADRAGQRLAEA
jgi:choline dehydrogenase-like flavoprotein